MRITVAGSGYVALVTDDCFNESDVNMDSVDVQVDVIKQAN